MTFNEDQNQIYNPKKKNVKNFIFKIKITSVYISSKCDDKHEKYVRKFFEKE